MFIKKKTTQQTVAPKKGESRKKKSLMKGLRDLPPGADVLLTGKRTAKERAAARAALPADLRALIGKGRITKRGKKEKMGLVAAAPSPYAPALGAVADSDDEDNPHGAAQVAGMKAAAAAAAKKKKNGNGGVAKVVTPIPNTNDKSAWDDLGVATNAALPSRLKRGIRDDASQPMPKSMKRLLESRDRLKNQLELEAQTKSKRKAQAKKKKGQVLGFAGASSVPTGSSSSSSGGNGNTTSQSSSTPGGGGRQPGESYGAFLARNRLETTQVLINAAEAGSKTKAKRKAYLESRDGKLPAAERKAAADAAEEKAKNQEKKSHSRDGSGGSGSHDDGDDDHGEGRKPKRQRMTEFPGRETVRFGEVALAPPKNLMAPIKKAGGFTKAKSSLPLSMRRGEDGSLSWNTGTNAASGTKGGKKGKKKQLAPVEEEARAQAVIEARAAYAALRARRAGLKEAGAGGGSLPSSREEEKWM